MLAGLKMPGGWLFGELLTLADLHLAPTAECRALLTAFPQLEDWWTKISVRPGFAATERR